MNNLKESNIIVTGATGGIGNSIIKILYEAGANILASGFISTTSNPKAISTAPSHEVRSDTRAFTHSIQPFINSIFSPF